MNQALFLCAIMKKAKAYFLEFFGIILPYG